MEKDTDQTKPNPEPKYCVQISVSCSNSDRCENAEVTLDPRFNRAGELVWFAEVSSTQEWTAGKKLTALRVAAYRNAVAVLKGREPTPEDADDDEVVRITDFIDEERVQDPFGTWITVMRWVAVEAYF